MRCCWSVAAGGGRCIVFGMLVVTEVQWQCGVGEDDEMDEEGLEGSLAGMMGEGLGVATEIFVKMRTGRARGKKLLKPIVVLRPVYWECNLDISIWGAAGK